MTARLAWMIEWGPFEKNLIVLAKRNPKDIPEALRNKPELPDRLRFPWRVFEECHEIRNTDGIHAIPNTEIEAWLNIHQITDAWTRQDLFMFVRRLDSSWRAEMHKKHGNT